MSDLKDLVELKPEDFGLDKEKKEVIEIIESFQPKVDEINVLKEEIKDVIELEITEENIPKFREVRLKLTKFESSLEKIRKSKKDFFLKGGRFVDGISKIMSLKEDKLLIKEKEDYFINREKEIIENLRIQRQDELEAYGYEDIPENIGNMNDKLYETLLSGVKSEFEERKAEEERLQKEEEERNKLKEIEDYRKYKTSRLIPFIDNYYDIVFSSLSQNKFDDLCKSAIKKRDDKELEEKRIREENEKLKLNVAKLEEKSIKLEGEIVEVESKSKEVAVDSNDLIFVNKKYEEYKKSCFFDLVEKIKLKTYEEVKSDIVDGLTCKIPEGMPREDFSIYSTFAVLSRFNSDGFKKACILQESLIEKWNNRSKPVNVYSSPMD